MIRKYQGCLLGLAIGDALGAPVEFLSLEEALAISLYCSLKFSDNFERGTLAAVNHSGDSDSTGSITGAILGTLLGVQSIPKSWVQKVEGSDRIKKIVDDMFRVFQNGKELSLKDFI